jgi:hypothetical protein
METRVGGNGHADPRVSYGTDRVGQDSNVVVLPSPPGLRESSSAIRSTSAPSFGAPVRRWRWASANFRGREFSATGVVTGVLDVGGPRL